MALKDTFKLMKHLLDSLQKDLAKAETGNKAASQRVRTLSIKFEKTAKIYRKESIKSEKSGSLKKAAKTKKMDKKTPTSKKVCCGKKMSAHHSKASCSKNSKKLPAKKYTVKPSKPIKSKRK
ncbi:MAG: hypothetical protein RRZ67_00945 [Victivallaceae bacterium]